MSKATELGAQSGANWAAPAIGAGMGILGMLGQKKREKRAMNNQRELMGVQFRHQQELNQQGHDLQKKMWEETNYPAQMQMMEEAGLNPGLMYGMSGGGGTTTGSQGGGSAQSGSAPAPQPMELGTAIQAATTAASIELMKANADKAKAEAENLRGGEGTLGASQIEANKAAALNATTQAEINKLGLEIGNATKEDQIDEIHYRVEGLIKQNDLTDAQAEKARVETTAIGVRMQLDKANINVANETVNKIINEIAQGWKKLDNELLTIGIMNQGNKLRALDGKSKLMEIQTDFALGILGKEIDLHKLNIEQQKVLASLFQSLFVGSAISKATPEKVQPVKGFR